MSTSNDLRQQVESLIHRLDGNALAEVTRSVRQAEAAVAAGTAPCQDDLLRCEEALNSALKALEKVQLDALEGADDTAASGAAAELLARASGVVEQCMAARVVAATSLEECQARSLQAQQETWRTLLDGFADATDGAPGSDAAAADLRPSVQVLVEIASGSGELLVLSGCGGLVDDDFAVVVSDEATHEVEGTRVALARCYKPGLQESLDRLPAPFLLDKALLLLQATVHPREGEGMGLPLTNANVAGKLAPESAAAQAGIREGDVVVACDGEYLGGRMLSNVIQRGAPTHSFGLLRPTPPPPSSTTSTSTSKEAPADDALDSLSALRGQIDSLLRGTPPPTGAAAKTASSASTTPAAVTGAAGVWGGVHFVELEPTDDSAITVAWELNPAR